MLRPPGERFGPLHVYLVLTIAKSALAQDQTTQHQAAPTTMDTTTSPTNIQTTDGFILTPSSSIPLPSSSDGAPARNHHDDMNSSGIVNYYFVFLALILALAGAIVFIIMRRRHRTVLRRRYSQNVALTRDLGGPREGGGWSNWNPERTRGRYWQGRWRGADASREEGLNEQGEAPPPYVPKRQSEEAQREATEPAVPLQTLSRDGAGLKPPDYSEYQSRDFDEASSSRETDRRTGS